MIMVIGPHRRKSEAKADRPAQHGERASSRQRAARNSAGSGPAEQPTNGAGQAPPESAPEGEAGD
jgi:hypothetical protein